MFLVQLWIAYLAERRLAVRGLSPTDGALEALNNTYERALVTMHKMPRIWLDYLSLLVDQRLVTRTRRSFDRALCALPITQHDRIWQLYLVRPALQFRACRSMHWYCHCLQSMSALLACAPCTPECPCSFSSGLLQGSRLLSL